MGKALSKQKQSAWRRDTGHTQTTSQSEKRRYSQPVHEEHVREEHVSLPVEKAAVCESGESYGERESPREDDDDHATSADTRTSTCTSTQGEILELEKRVEMARPNVMFGDSERARQVRLIEKRPEEQRSEESATIEGMMAALVLTKTQPLPTRGPPPPDGNDSGVDCSPPSIQCDDDRWSSESSPECAPPLDLYTVITKYGKDIDMALDLANRPPPLPRLIRPRLVMPTPFPRGQPASDSVQKYLALTFVNQLLDDELIQNVSLVLQRDHFPVNHMLVSRYFLLDAFFARLQRSSPCAYLNQPVGGVTLLFQAIEARMPDVVSALLQYGADPRVRNTEDGLSALHGQVVRGGGDMYLSTVKALMDHFPYDSDEFRELRDMVDASGYSALTLALMCHDGNSGESHRELLDTARFLLRCGARPQADWRQLGFDRQVVPLLNQMCIQL